MFQPWLMLNSEGIFCNNFKPPSNLALGIFEILQPMESIMVSSNNERPPPKVRTKTFHCPHQSQHFPSSGTVQHRYPPGWHQYPQQMFSQIVERTKWVAITTSPLNWKTLLHTVLSTAKISSFPSMHAGELLSWQSSR